MVVSAKFLIVISYIYPFHFESLKLLSYVQFALLVALSLSLIIFFVV